MAGGKDTGASFYRIVLDIFVVRLYVKYLIILSTTEFYRYVILLGQINHTSFMYVFLLLLLYCLLLLMTSPAASQLPLRPLPWTQLFLNAGGVWKHAHHITPSPSVSTSFTPLYTYLHFSAQWK